MPKIEDKFSHEVERQISVTPSLDFPAKHSSVPIKTHEEGIVVIREVPVYGPALVDEKLCSKYVRMAARDMFGKFYAKTHAWNRRYDDRLVTEVEGRSLKELANMEILLPGMIIGIENPSSSMINEIDKQGNKALYTHNALYIGRNRNGEPLFAEQFVFPIIIRTESNMSSDNLRAVEILDSRS